MQAGCLDSCTHGWSLQLGLLRGRRSCCGPQCRFGATGPVLNLRLQLVSAASAVPAVSTEGMRKWNISSLLIAASHSTSEQPPSGEWWSWAGWLEAALSACLPALSRLSWGCICTACLGAIASRSLGCSRAWPLCPDSVFWGRCCSFSPSRSQSGSVLFSHVPTCP